MKKINLSIISGVLICGSVASAASSENIKLETSADILISKDLLRSSILKDKKFEYELENLKLMKEQVTKDALQNEFEKDKIHKSFSSNDLIEKETKVKSKRLDLNFAEEEKRIEYLGKYPMSMLGIEPQKKDLINNIAEAELEKAKSINEVKKNSSIINRSLKQHSDILKTIYLNNNLISKSLNIAEENLKLDKKINSLLLSSLKTNSNNNLILLDRIAFNEQNFAIYGETIIKLRKNLFLIKNKIDFFTIYNLKSNSDILIKNEILNIENILSDNNELLNILFSKNYQNSTEESIQKNDKKSSKSSKIIKIDKLKQFKNILNDLNNDKITLEVAKSKAELNHNLNKKETIKYLNKEIKKIEKQRRSEITRNKERRKQEIEKLKLKSETAKSLAEKMKIEAEIKEKNLMEQRLKSEEISRIEKERSDKNKREKEEESEIRNNYKIVSYYNGVLTLKNNENSKIKLYKNTKIKEWTFVNWKAKEMEAIFEKDGRYITKKLKVSMDNVVSETEQIGTINTKQKTAVSTSVTSIPTTGTDSLEILKK